MDIQDLTQLPNTRQEAIDLGSKYYFTGKPCKHGHLDKRHIGNLTCVSCSYKRNADYRRDNKEKISKSKKEWHHKNRNLILLKKKEYRSENLEKCRQSVRNWAKNNPEKVKIKARESALNNWGKYLERHKKWRDNNKDKVSAWCASWKRNNKEKIKEMNKNWAKRNPEAIRINRLNRISRKRKAEGSFSKKDIGEKLKIQNNKCIYCKCDISVFYHVDHILPLYRGGSNWPYNLQILCPSCNCSKGAKTHDEFIEFLRKQKSVAASE